MRDRVIGSGIEWINWERQKPPSDEGGVGSVCDRERAPLEIRV